MKHYDFVIAGGGLAGLSLACRLARSTLRSRPILVIDHADRSQHDRTFSFWSQEPDLFDSAVSHSWHKLRVAGRDGDRCLDLGAYSYHTMRGGDFHRCACAILQRFGVVEYLDAHIDRIEDGDRFATVRMGDQTISGTWVFDSMLDAGSPVVTGNGCTRLNLTFVGWEIQTERDVFQPDVVTFMDFRTPQKDDLRFFYVLPFAPNRALVEYTAFTGGRLAGSEANAALLTYLREAFALDSYQVLAREGGCLPITDAPYPRRLGRRVMAIGVKGGLLKPTTGYAYSRIQDDSMAIVASLLTHGHPFDVPAGDPSYRWLDTVMLRVMARYGGDMHTMMETLLARNPIERVLSFLDEESNPLDILQIMASLPPSRFIEAALLNHQ
ncbi:MAG: lycopene cyclase family protein [Caldilineales bacterium]